MLKLFKRLAGHKKNVQRTITYIDYDDNETIKTYTSDDIGINNLVVYSNVMVLHDTKYDNN